MPEFLVTVTRTYTVRASSPEKAVSKAEDELVWDADHVGLTELFSFCAELKNDIKQKKDMYPDKEAADEALAH